MLKKQRGKAPHGQMADSHGQGVGGVQRPVGLADVEQALDHKGHLLLFRPACAHQGLFDQGRLVVADSQAIRRAGRHGHASGLAQLEGAGRVFGGKDLFNGRFVGLAAPEHLGQLMVNARQPRGKFLSG